MKQLLSSVWRIKLLREMSKQPKISAFIKSTGSKRNSESNEIESKKKKLDDGEGKDNNGAGGDTCSDNASPPSAQMKLAGTNTHGLVQHMGETWFKALEAEFSKPYFLQLSKFVAEERKKNTIYPPAHQVFSFTQMSELKELKVVILGQDPYHGPTQAHGLCFSVQKGVTPPPSLANMYKELTTDVTNFKHPGHGYLGGWAEQGVLLLNAVLTVKASSANSHKGQGWEKFTDAIVSYINQNLEGVVFLLWGGYAHKKGARIDKKRHHVLEGVHPSPLSAHRGFMGCKHFSKCNELLEKDDRTPIDWTHLPLPNN